MLFAGVPVDELAINGLTAAEAFFGAVPKIDSLFAQFPAKAYIVIAEAAHEINQADIEIFDQRAGLLDLFQGLFHSRGGSVAARTRGQKRSWIDANAASHLDTRGGGF